MATKGSRQPTCVSQSAKKRYKGYAYMCISKKGKIANKDKTAGVPQQRKSVKATDTKARERSRYTCTEEYLYIKL